MMETPHLLIVDDDAALLQALPQTLYLRMRDVQVDTCEAAPDALALMQEHDYDAIISDIKMPGMDGLELLEKCRDIQPETPVLLITGHGEHGLAIQALRGGAYDYIQKPIDRDAFIAAIQRAIQTRQLRRQVAEQHRALSLHAQSLEWLVQKRTSELMTANATKDKFLSIVAHELKVPLSTLRERTQLLERQLDEETDKDVLKQGVLDMKRSIDRTDVMVQDLLDTSLMNTNMFVLHREHRDLVEVCHDLLDEFTRGVGPVLTCEIYGKPLEAEVDSNRLRQVFMNLLSNARKYSPKGSPITVTLQQSGYEAIISVRDMGMGIPAEAIPHIFTEFYRVPGVPIMKDGHPDLGLGLYIARKIIERHGGRIDVESTPGEGSVFSMTLPLAVVPASRNLQSPMLSSRTPHMQAIWTIIY